MSSLAVFRVFVAGKNGEKIGNSENFHVISFVIFLVTSATGEGAVQDEDCTGSGAGSVRAVTADL